MGCIALTHRIEGRSGPKATYKTSFGDGRTGGGPKGLTGSSFHVEKLGLLFLLGAEQNHNSGAHEVWILEPPLAVFCSLFGSSLASLVVCTVGF